MTTDIRGLEIKAYDGEGYDRTHIFGGWRVAFLNYAPHFDNITYLERHLLTDEVFVLLEGEATLYVGEDGTPVEMEYDRIYNITAGSWHNVRVSRDAKLLIVENSETGRENSEYMDFSVGK